MADQVTTARTTAPTNETNSAVRLDTFCLIVLEPNEKPLIKAPVTMLRMAPG
jgi:hypothetical protein